jgi:aryl-alcohol dehydrogenase-like predicted oxidoreductase
VATENPRDAISGRNLGRTGLIVYPVGLGAMPLSLDGRPDEKTGIAVIHAALDAGVTLIDTADSYCRDESDVGHNERLIAKALGAHSAGRTVTVATKGGHVRPRGAWMTDGRPERLRRCCEASLKALGVETIALYQFHRPDPRVPFADSVGALARLKQEGKIRHVGLSNVSAAQLAAAQKIVRVESVQNECNVFQQDDLRNGVIAACLQQGVSYIAYSPVGGFWGGKQRVRHPLLAAIGKAHGVSPYQVALAWLLALGPHVLPIPGASRAASIRDSAAAARLQLSPDELKRIGALGR